MFQQRFYHSDYHSFNPSIVRFKLTSISNFQDAMNPFNPNIVRLKRVSVAAMSHFNPYIVRFKLAHVPVLNDTGTFFQTYYSSVLTDDTVYCKS